MGHLSGVECTGGAGQGRKGNQSKKKHFSQRTLSLRIPPCAWNVPTCVRSARFLDCWHCVSPSSQNMLTASSARHWSTLVVLISATTLAANCHVVEAMPMSKVTLLHLISEQLLGELTFAMNKPHLVVASACWSEMPWSVKRNHGSGKTFTGRSPFVRNHGAQCHSVSAAHVHQGHPFDVLHVLHRLVSACNAPQALAPKQLAHNDFLFVSGEQAVATTQVAARRCANFFFASRRVAGQRDDLSDIRNAWSSMAVARCRGLLTCACCESRLLYKRVFGAKEQEETQQCLARGFRWISCNMPCKEYVQIDCDWITEQALWLTHWEHLGRDFQLIRVCLAPSILFEGSTARASWTACAGTAESLGESTLVSIDSEAFATVARHSLC